MSQRLPASAHTRQPWRIHTLAPDFELEDVWRVRTPGAGEDDFDAVVAAIFGDGGRPDGEGLVGRLLFSARWRLGAVLGWDQPAHGMGTWTSRVADRVDEELPAAWPGSPFTPIYRAPSEHASEMANGTMHGIMHLGWVERASGDYELRVAVLVKANRTRGRSYMRLITPFRVFLVWPPMIAAWERAWRELDRVTGGRIEPPQEPGAAWLNLRPDYIDVFTITTKVTASPREWMSACFEEGVDRSGRDFIFGRLLALRTEPDGFPGTIAGWQVVDEDFEHLTLRACGPRVEVNLVMNSVEGGTRLTTAVRYHSRWGRLIWERLSRVHRRKAPEVLRTGNSILRSR